MDRKNSPKKPASAKAKRAGRAGPVRSITDWLSQHLMLVTVIVLAILVFVVILIAASGGDDETGPVARPDSSGPIQVGELELNIHQWNCGLTALERLDDPEADPIRAADGNHFCTLAVQVTNLNLDKARAFDPAGQRIVFGNQEYVYNPVATRDGLGAISGVRILEAGIGADPETVPPLINMVFEIPQDSDELAWRSDAILALTSGGGDEAPVEVPLKDYDKQT